MLNRSLGWMLVALGLGALHPIGASAQGDPSTPLPAGVTACKFAALIKDCEPGGPAIRDAPRQDGREVGRLPAQGGELPEIQVIGFKDGWFLIEGAADPGRGWVEDKFVTTHLYRDTLRKAPSNDSSDVSHLYGTRSNGFSYQPYDLEVQRVLECSGRWLEVEIHRPDATTLSGKPAAAADGTVRGWTDRSCTKTERRSVHGGAVRLSLVAAAGRRDGMPGRSGHQRSRPGRSQRTRRTGPKRSCPRPSAPRDTGALPRSTSNFFVLPKIQVISYSKGWFLIEMGGRAPPTTTPICRRQSPTAVAAGSRRAC